MSESINFVFSKAKFTRRRLASAQYLFDLNEFNRILTLITFIASKMNIYESAANAVIMPFTYR